MNDPGIALRKAFYAALNGNLSYSGANVPVYDMKAENAPKVYVVLSSVTTLDSSNKTAFATIQSIDVDVCNVRYSTAQSEALDHVSNQILAILMPTTKTVGITLDAPFNLTYCKLDTARLSEPQPVGQTEFGQAKRLTFKNRITQ